METDELIDVEIPAARSWLHDTVVSLVDFEKYVHVTAEMNVLDGLVSYTIKVSPEDTGKVIGRQGRMARCLRILIAARSTKLKYRSALNIIESPREQSAPAHAVHIVEQSLRRA